MSSLFLGLSASAEDMENTYAERRSNDYKATLLGISLIGKVPAKFKKYALWIDRYILRRVSNYDSCIPRSSGGRN